MIKDLYDTLGVPHDADKAQIRKAYRQRAKKAHPDQGGSPELFGALVRAHAVLTDEKRRAQYDRTGRVDEPEPDSTLAKAMNVVVGALGQIMTKIDQRSASYDEFDMLGDAKTMVRGDIANVERQIKDAKRSAEKLTRAAAKMRSKPGKVDRIGPLLKGKAADAERTAAQLAETIDVLKIALNIIEDHTFEFHAASRQPGNPFSQVGMWT